jgi:hypothetical protein
LISLLSDFPDFFKKISNLISQISHLNYNFGAYKKVNGFKKLQRCSARRSGAGTV